MKKKRFTIFHMFLAVLLTLAVALGGTALTAWVLLENWGISLLQSAVLVNTRFVGEYQGKEISDSALAGLVAGLGDRWSHYVDADSYAALRQTRSNSYVGIGVTVSYEDERGLTILSVREGGPAEQAGLCAGEIIVEVDGSSAAGENQSDAVDAIQGEEGTEVSLTLLAQDGSTRTIVLCRQSMDTQTVKSQLLEGNVGLITVSNFYTGSAQQAQQAVEELEAAGAEALIFDMRNNPGGYVSELTRLLDYLMPEGVIFQDTTKLGMQKAVKSDASCVELPIAVLVNSETYSAAEFFGAELQEEGRAVIVGSRTSGKGYSQETFPLPNGGALLLSTGKYVTGSGVSLIGTGVTLDVEVELTEEENVQLASGTLSVADDRQLRAALELLEK